MAGRKTSAEKTKEALIDAVIRLLGRRSVADISVRDIALEAGVNHGLVHRYFGSKERLIREAFVRTNASVHRSHLDRAPGSVTSWSFDLLRRRPELARVVARCCLDGPRDVLELAGPPPERHASYLRPIRAALRRAGLEGRIDPAVVNAAGAAALLGWVVFRPLLEAGYKVPRDADDQMALLASLLDSTLMAATEPDGKP
jgi:AcrR family transcriptional regulator